jgi:hypothetical protein
MAGPSTDPGARPVERLQERRERGGRHEGERLPGRVDALQRAGHGLHRAGVGLARRRRLQHRPQIRRKAEARGGVGVGQGLQEGLGGTQRRLAGLLEGFVQQEQHFGADLAGGADGLDERIAGLDEQVVRVRLLARQRIGPAPGNGR